jgi:isocitrate/isopropylmalate dehydrogenase
MLRHIGLTEKADRLKKAVNAAERDPKIHMTGTKEGSTTAEFADAVLALL